MQNNYIKFKPMRIYKLHRSNELDHENGRPAIFIKFFGFESLVWTGTTKVNKEAKDEPLIMNLNNHKTYFYDQNIQKVLTSNLIGKWRNNQTKKIYNLTEQEKIFLCKKIQNLFFKLNI